MKKESIITVLCFGLLFFCGAFSFEAKAADFVVTKTADTDGNCNSNVDCSFREAIKAANAAASNDRIFFASSLGGLIFPVTSEIVIANNGSLSVEGLGVYGLTPGGIKFLMTGTNRILYTNSASVTVSNLTLSGGKGFGSVSTNNDRGGAIFVNSGSVTLNGVYLVNNSASQGGAIYNRLGTLNLTNSAVTGNTAAMQPGLCCSEGGGIYDVGNLTVQNSLISSNTAEIGGGIHSDGGITLTNTTITDNFASSYGGGINMGQSAISNASSLNNVTVAYNRSASTGAGINSGSNLYFHNTVVAKNTLTCSNCTEPDIAGLIYSNGFNIIGHVDNSTLFNIKPSDKINVDPKLNSLASNGGLTKTISLQQNSPAIDAGDTAIFPSTDQRGIIRPMDGNGDGTAQPDIGALESGVLVTNTSASGTGSLRNAIAAAPANGEVVFGSIFSDPSGKTISLSGSALDISKNLTVTGPGANLLTIDGNFLNRILNLTTASLTLSGVTLADGYTGNSANGGAILISGGTFNGSNIVVKSSIGNLGGCIYNSGTLNLTGSIITDCHANESAGIFNDAGHTATLLNSTVSNSSTAISGGAPTGIAGGIENRGTLTIANSTVTGNSATRGAGVNSSNALTIINSVVANNQATDNFGGGGIYNSAPATITNSTLSGNSAPNGKGGGIYNTADFNTKLTTTNATVAGNSAGSGGGVFNDDAIALNGILARNTIFAGNTASLAGADFYGTFFSNGYNLIGSTNQTVINGTGTGNILNVSAQLAPLGNYGGATQTHALLGGSPAIDSADPNGVISTDQRGVMRPLGSRADIGAFERNIIFNPTSLPNGQLGAAYDQHLTAADENNFTNLGFSIIEGQLPPGLLLSPSGDITGTIGGGGNATYAFTVKAETPSANGGTAGAQQYSIFIPSPLIGGRVTDLGTGVGGVTVNLTGTDTASTTTNSNGYYSFANLQAGGNYTVTPTLSGYAFSPASKTITNLETQNDVNFVRAYSISGYLYQPDATTPVGNVQVNLTGGSAAQTTTNASGYYEFTNLAAGSSYTISPLATNLYSFAPQTVGSLTGNVTRNFTGTLRSYTISGKIFAANGTTPVSGVAINLSGGSTAQTTSDVNGFYQFTNLAAGGSYTITPVSNTFFSFTAQMINSLTGNATLNFTATARIYTISGRVLSNLNVALRDITVTLGGMSSGTTTTNQNGEFSFPNLTATGNYTINAADSTPFVFDPLSINNLGSDQNVNVVGKLTPLDPNGPIAWYRGNNADDSSGNNFNGVNNGAAFAPGKFGQAFSFDGMSSNIVLPRTIQDDFTIEFWFKTTDVSGTGNDQWYLGKGLIDADFPGTANDFGVAIGNTRVLFGVGNPNGTTFGTQGYHDNNWHYVAATRLKRTGTIALYIDGFKWNELAGQYANTRSLNSSDTITLGKIQTNSNYFRGLLDEVKFYNRVLTGTEVSAHFNNPNAAFNTATGADVTVSPAANLSVKFSSVSDPGTTAPASYASGNQLPALPNGFSYFSPFTTYDLRTSAIYSGNISVTMNVPNVSSAAVCSGLLIGHYTGGAWTTAGNSAPVYDAGTQACTLVATTNSLSPFAILQNLAPTAAGASISGRVLTADGKGLMNATVILTDASGNKRSVQTSAFGYYRFDDAAAGQTCVFTVISKRYQFAPQVVNVTEDLTALNFTAQ